MTRESGSILVESLVATAFLATVLGSTLGVIADGRARDRAVTERRLALLVARSQLAAAGAEGGLRVGSTEGVEGDFSWRVTVEPCGEGGLSTAGELQCLAAEVRSATDGPTLARLTTRRLGAAT